MYEKRARRQDERFMNQVKSIGGSDELVKLIGGTARKKKITEVKLECAQQRERQ